MEPKHCVYRQFGRRRRFGVELELNQSIPQAKLASIIQQSLPGSQVVVQPWGYTFHNNHWVVKTDSTCGDNGEHGFEVCSPVGSGKDHLKRLGIVTSALSAAAAKTNERCAMHCHVGIEDFRKLDVIRLARRWTMIERFIMQMVPEHRRKNKYCKSFRRQFPRFSAIRQTTKDSEKMWGLMSLKSLNPPAKRTAVTFVNYQRTLSESWEWQYFDRPTVELRLPECSLASHDVINWSRLFVHFVQTCKRIKVHSVSKDIDGFFSILGLGADDTPCVLSPGLYQTKLWTIHRILAHSDNTKLKRTVQRYLENTLRAVDIRWRYGFDRFDLKIA